MKPSLTLMVPGDSMRSCVDMSRILDGCESPKTKLVAVLGATD